MALRMHSLPQLTCAAGQPQLPQHMQQQQRAAAYGQQVDAGQGEQAGYGAGVQVGGPGLGVLDAGRAAAAGGPVTGAALDVAALPDGYQFPEWGSDDHSHPQGGGNNLYGYGGCSDGCAHGLDAHGPPDGPVPTGKHLETRYVLGGPAPNPCGSMYGMAQAPMQPPYPPVPGNGTGGHHHLGRRRIGDGGPWAGPGVGMGGCI